MARYALIIGIAEYTGSFRSLETPVQNANAIADIFDQYGDFNQVKRLPFRREAGQKDLGKVIRKPLLNETLVRELQQFLQDADGSDVLIYYSGHGFTKLDQLSQTPEGYLAPSDCQVELNAAGQVVAEKNGISLFGLNVLINRHTFNSLVVILDCCNAGAFLESGMVRRDVTAFDYQRDYYLITACRSSSKAYEGEEYSLLTAAVLKGLSPENAAPGSGRISGDRLFDVIGNELQNSRQEPIRMGWGRLITLVRYLQQSVSLEPAPHPFNPANPYMGLKPFEQEQSSYFFGREQAVRALLDRLNENRFLAVIGPSGCGKSSLVRAGLLPELRDDRIPGSSEWQIKIITPGQYPLQALTNVLEQHHSNNKPIVLFVDQFEELFTLCPNEEEQRTFIKRLNEETNDPDKQTRIIIAMRGDFLDRCAKFQESADLINSTAPTTYIVTPLTETKLVAELEESITCPAALHGVSFENGLVARIVDDVINQPGAMPLLQYALTQLWDNCISSNGISQLLTLGSYEAIDGVKGALQRWADQFYTNLSSTDQTFVREMVGELVQLGDGGEVTRRRAPWERLHQIAASQKQLERIVGQLVYQRLLVADDQTVEVAHEALLSESRLIQGWIEENRDSIRLQQRLEIYCREWEEHDRSEDYLLDAGRLAAIEEWLEKKQPRLMSVDQEFIRKSKERRDREQLAELERVIQLQKLAEDRQQEAEKNLKLEKQRNTLIFRSWLLISGLLASAAVSAFIFAQYSQKAAQVAQEGRANTLVTLAETYIHDNQQLEALITSIDALTLLQKSDIDTSKYLTRLKTTVTNIQERNRWQGHSKPIYALSINDNVNNLLPDQALIASGSIDGTIKLWNFRGELLKELKGQNTTVWSLAFSHDGKLLASTGFDGKVRLWNVEQGNLEYVFPGHSGKSFDIVFSYDDKTLASSGSDGTVKLWTIDEKKREESILVSDENPYYILGVDFNPKNNSIIAYGGEGDNSVKIKDLSSREPPIKLIDDNETRGITQVKFSPDGLKLATASGDGRINLWSVTSPESPKLLAEITGDNQNIYALGFSKDGNFLVTGGAEQKIRVWEIDRVIKRYQEERQPIQASNALTILEGHTAAVNRAFFLSLKDKESLLSRELIVSASDDQTIRVWDWQSNPIFFADTNVDALLNYGCQILRDYSQTEPSTQEAISHCQ